MSNVRRISRFFLGLCLLAGAGIVLMFSAAFLYLSPNLPSVDVLRDVRLQTPLRVFTQNGELIGEFGEMRRTPIKFADIPPLFIKAVLAAEDDSFYSHHGVDFKSLMRATSQLAASGHIQTGGSTITMQVARNYLLSYEKTFSRKFNEILLALQIERSLSKNEILELYVNKIFLGNRAYGIEAAAQVYYGKSINELNLAELAMIAGIPKAPSSNNPIANPERALQRRNWILGRMLSLNSISRMQYDEAIQQPVGASYHGAVVDLDAGYAAEMARQEMLERFGPKVYTEGYVAYTTLDGRLQRTADQAVVETLLTYAQRHGYRGPERRLKPAANGDDQSAWRRQVATLPVLGGLWPAAVISVGERSFQALFSNGQTAQVQWENGVSDAARYSDVDHRGRSPQQASDVVAVGDVVRLRRDGKGEWQLQQIPAVQGALVSLNSDNGAILSLTGGFDFRQSKFNRVTQAARQPGSNFKPFIYTAALEHGFTPATIINDAPIVFQDDQMENAWRPVNDTGKFYGPTPLRQALFKSRNVVSIRVLHQLGVDTAINYVKRFGFDSSAMPRDLSLALGSLSATPMQIVRGFAVFANGGYLIEPYLIQRVLDRNGELVYEAKPKVACAGCGPETVATNPDAPNPPSAPNVTAPDATVALTTTGAPNAQMAPQVLDPRYAFIMDTMLRDVVRRGTAQGASTLGRNDLAGKTGTTNGPTDLWFTGYAGGIVTTTWVGFDQNTPLGRREYGATTALPMWMNFMKVALAGRPERQMKQPEGVVSLRIDPHTGLRARPDQSDAIFEYFTEETAPTQESAPGAGSGSSTGGMSEQDLF